MSRVSRLDLDRLIELLTWRVQFTCADFEAMGREFGVSLALSSSKALHDRVKGAPEVLQRLIRLDPPDRSNAQGKDITASDGAGTEHSSCSTQPSSARTQGTSTPQRNAAHEGNVRGAAPHQALAG